MKLHLIYPPMPQAIRAMLDAAGPDPERHRVMSQDMAVLVERHVRRAARLRHASAMRLGAAPTGHLERAADSVRPEPGGGEIAVYVDSPGFRRVEEDVKIRPRVAGMLTIPLHAVAYGRRVYSTERLLGERLFRPLRKGGKRGRGPYMNVLGRRRDGAFQKIYALKDEVTLPQDRGLLPTDDEFRLALGNSLRRFLKDKLAEGGGI